MVLATSVLYIVRVSAHEEQWTEAGGQVRDGGGG